VLSSPGRRMRLGCLRMNGRRVIVWDHLVDRSSHQTITYLPLRKMQGFQALRRLQVSRRPAAGSATPAEICPMSSESAIFEPTGQVADFASARVSEAEAASRRATRSHRPRSCGALIPEPRREPAHLTDDWANPGFVSVGDRTTRRRLPRRRSHARGGVGTGCFTRSTR